MLVVKQGLKVLQVPTQVKNNAFWRHMDSYHSFVNAMQIINDQTA